MPTLYDLFQNRAAESPGKIAVEVQRSDCIESYTYKDLRYMAEAIGSWLTQQALGRNARVAILADNHPHWLAAYLGVLAAGGVVVPLDTSHQPAQVAKLLTDSSSSAILCDAKHLAVAREAAADGRIRTVVLDGSRVGEAACAATAGAQKSASVSFSGQFDTTLARILETGPGQFAAASCPDDDLAILLYTSGTTADPKGVMLSHANLVAEVNAAVAWAPLNSDDSVLGLLPLFHVLAQITNLVVPLAVGARVVFLDNLNVNELMRALSERKITGLSVVPQFFYLIHERIFKEVAARGWPTRLAVRSLMTLTRFARRMGINPGKLFFGRIHRVFGERMTYLLSAGSPFNPQVARDFYSLGIDIMQAYGLTETTSAAFATPPAKVVIGSVGPPLSGIQARIADPQFDENCNHEVGEILIQGPTVMKGYWNRPDATAQVLREGWLYSGDLGYFDARGNLFITGRKKEVIILGNGKNIYPEEVEAHYLKSPFIKEICVLGLEPHGGSSAPERLHAVVVPNFDELKQRKIVNAKEVLRFDIEALSVQLPSTKRIGSYEIWQEALPRTTTRKIKRFEVERRVRANQSQGAAAAAMDSEKPLSAEDSAWLQQPEVQRSLGVVRDICRTTPPLIRPDANLELDLGLDSMQRIELITALEQTLGCRTEISRLAEAYTIRQLIDGIRENAVTRPGISTVPGGWSKILQEDPQDAEVLVLKKRSRAPEAVWYLLNRIFALIAYLFFRLRVDGLEKLPARGPFLICANHQSLMDSIIMCSLLRWGVFREIFFVGTSEIFSSGFMRLLARWRRIIIIDPDANLLPAMRAGAFGLKHGRVLVLYPEGERSIDGTPKTFKKGAAILSLQMQAPIVPVAIEGFHDAWPRERRFPRLAHLQIKFGDLIYPSAEAEASPTQYEQLTAELRKKVVEMWEELRSRKSGTT